MTKHFLIIAVGIAFVSPTLFCAIPPVTEFQPSHRQAMESRLYESPAWLKLLHYKHSPWGGYESQADGMAFFLSEEGKTSPKSELEANINAFFVQSVTADGEPLPDSHPICQFPARFRWLKKALNQSRLELPARSCPRLTEFRQSIGAKSASIVFSSYYLNNPASAFGHTLLRLNRTENNFEGKRYELLDTGINFGAEVDENNPILYAIKGLFGAFKGTFKRIPYYYKVREYNDFESRDLWVYDLNLTSEQVDRLVDHIWELGSTHFDYYYLSENCSYHILTALEGAIPELNLTDHLPYVVVPADTIKALNRTPGLVAKIHYRPSIRSQFLNRVQRLSPERAGLARQIVASKDLSKMPTSLSDGDRAEVLDSAIDYFDFKSFRALVGEPDGEEAKWKQRLLVSRAQIPIQTAELTVPTPIDEAPHAGHEIMRVGIETGKVSGGGPYSGLQFRFALHDLIDPKRGYPRNAQIEFFSTKVRYLWRESYVWLEELDLFRVISLSPLTQFDRRLSWKARIGGTTLRDRGTDHSFAGRFEIGFGPSFEITRLLTLFVSIDGESYFTPNFRPRSWLRPGAGPSSLLTLQLSPSLLVQAEAAYRLRAFSDELQSSHFSGELRWALSKDLALNLKSALFPDTWENSSSVYLYF